MYASLQLKGNERGLLHKGFLVRRQGGRYEDWARCDVQAFVQLIKRMCKRLLQRHTPHAHMHIFMKTHSLPPAASSQHVPPMPQPEGTAVATTSCPPLPSNSFTRCP